MGVICGRMHAIPERAPGLHPTPKTETKLLTFTINLAFHHVSASKCNCDLLSQNHGKPFGMLKVKGKLERKSVLEEVRPTQSVCLSKLLFTGNKFVEQLLQKRNWP